MTKINGKKKTLKKEARYIIFGIFVIILIAIIFFRNQDHTYVISNDENEVGLAMIEEGYDKRIVYTYNAYDSSLGTFPNEFELIEEIEPKVTKYEYNQYGLLIKKTTLKNQNITQIIKREYDDNQKLIRIETLDESGFIINYKISRQDENGDILWLLYDKEGKEIGIAERYNAKNLLLEENKFDSTGEIALTIKNEYDHSNRLKVSSVYANGVEISTQNFSYYSKEKIKEMIYEGTDGTYQRSVYEYDRYGYLNKITIYDQNDVEIRSDIYAYDKNHLLLTITSTTKQDQLRQYIQIEEYKYEKGNGIIESGMER